MSSTLATAPSAVLVDPVLSGSPTPAATPSGVLRQRGTEHLPYFYWTNDKSSATVLGMDTATIVVTGLLAALFLSAAGMKLAGVPQSLEIRDHLGVAPAQWRLIGVLELAGA